MLKSRIALAFLAFAVSACSNEYAKLALELPPVHDFSSALASEYFSFAQSESEQNFWAYAEHFARKGRAAVQNSNVDPEEPFSWRVNSSELTALEAARADLIAVSTVDVRRIVPNKAARAQLLFDCWVVQASRNDNPPTPCQQEFESVVQDLHTLHQPHVMEEGKS